MLVLGCTECCPCGGCHGEPAGSERVKHLDDDSFAAEIAGGVVLVDFWAPWCGPCRAQGPIVDQVAETVGDRATVAKLNVDKAQDTARKFGIRSIPTLIVFKDGKQVKQFVGMTKAEELVAAIDAADKM
jgi:thioredoxin 1